MHRFRVTQNLQMLACMSTFSNADMHATHTQAHTNLNTRTHAKTHSTSFFHLFHFNTSFSCLNSFTLLIFFMPSRLFLVSHDFLLIFFPPSIHRSSVNSLPTLVFPRTKSRFFLQCNRGRGVWVGGGSERDPPPYLLYLHSS